MPQHDATSALTQLWIALTTTLAADSRISGQLSGFLGLVQPKGAIGDTLVLEVPDELAREMIEHRARTPILDALVAVGDPEISTFAVVVNSALRQAAPPSPATPGQSDTASNAYRDTTAIPLSPPPANAPADPPLIPAANTPPANAPVGSAPHGPVLSSIPAHSSGEPNRSSGPAVKVNRLNPKYTFDNFVIGASNRFAHAAAFAVAETPAKAYNPLFIYGESGLGKTHLLHAIGHYAISLFPGIRVLYVSSEEFTNDFINSIQRNEAAEFQSRYRDIDILLIDDIQFLQGKDSTQEAFFHTFNNLHDHNKQLVITSDLPPKQLTGFQDRMTSRFEWGLTTDVQAPELETRIAILRRKAESEHASVPDDILELIASKVSSNIRELEGTMLRVVAYASIEQRPVDFSVAQAALKDMITLADDNVIDPESIIQTTASYFSLRPADITGTSRAQQIALARQIAMYICRELTSLSLPKIGQLFGNRDHTTVMYANNKISRLMQERRAVYTQVTDISTAVKQAHR